MRFSYITLFSALFISSVAIYFSVAGLAAIYSAYASSIIIMGSAIELGKLVAVVWLHRHWETTKSWFKSLLIVSCAVVMFITSMGIFGYLSKSHIEQTSASQESIAHIERITSEIARNNAIILRANTKIKGFEDNGSGVDASLQTQIDREQRRIDSAYNRVEPVIEVQLQIIRDEEIRIADRIRPYTNEIITIDESLSDLQRALSKNQIRKAQAIAGTKPDGIFKGFTMNAIKDFRAKNDSRRKELLATVDKITSIPIGAVISARTEIHVIRKSVQNEIDESNKLITRLRSRLGKSKESDIEKLITEQQIKIKTANIELDVLIEDKFKIEAQHRQLEAEVGPIKYIAEFVSNRKADKQLLEKAVQWVTILIIFVFDPFAVLLLIAAQYSFEHERKQREIKDANDDKQEQVDVNETGDSQEDEIVEEQETINEKGYQPVYNDLDDSNPPEEDSTIVDDEILELDTLKDIPKETDYEQQIVSLIKVGENYINYNGKVFRAPALYQAFPELKLDFESKVNFGFEFISTVSFPSDGDLFIKTNTAPTQLFRYNGFAWDTIDKNLLEFNAYKKEYIQLLIDKIGQEDYNPELLNEFEKLHIEELLTKG